MGSGTDTAGPELLAELARLSSENADLRKAVENAEETDARSQQEKLEKTIEIMRATVRRPSYKYERRGPWQRDSEVSLFAVYQTLATSMMVEGSVMDMARTLALQIRADREQRADIVAVNQLRGLLADLMTLDLVRPSTQKHAVSDENEYWTLTGFGADLLKHMRRISLVESEGIKEAEDSGGGAHSDDMDEESE